MTFAADKHKAEFSGVTLFVSEYSLSRSGAVSETVLLDGTVSLYNGGTKSVRIKLCGTSEKPCAALLDGLLQGGTTVTLAYAGMVFEDVILTDYKCEGTSGCSEKVCAEFAGTSPIAEEVTP